MKKIPYTTQPHPLTRMSNGVLGMWLFLGSEIMLFAGLFSALIVMRFGAIDWANQQAALNTTLALSNTLFLFSSSMCYVISKHYLRINAVIKYRFFLIMVMILGGAFLYIKGCEYAVKLSQGHTPASHTFFATYFTLTGVHAFHVLAGLIVMLHLLLTSYKDLQKSPKKVMNRVNCTGLFWHFIDMIWVLLFLCLYIL
jgi:heme/copper-type cytochrome/quinol oxidase subunit 3